MAFSSDPAVLTLHGLRLTGSASAERVATVVDLPVEVVQDRLEALAAEGLTRFRDGRHRGWALTPEGRAEGERSLARELDHNGGREVVYSCYQRFLALNRRMLEVCTEWQVVDGQCLNDHSNPDYDAAVIDKLAAVDAAVQPICAELAGVAGRFNRYGALLTEALDRLRAGETDYFTKPLIPSYHTVWFELHEDLLATLGIDRASEAH